MKMQDATQTVRKTGLGGGFAEGQKFAGRPPPCYYFSEETFAAIQALFSQELWRIFLILSFLLSCNFPTPAVLTSVLRWGQRKWVGERKITKGVKLGLSFLASPSPKHKKKQEGCVIDKSVWILSLITVGTYVRTVVYWIQT